MLGAEPNLGAAVVRTLTPILVGFILGIIGSNVAGVDEGTLTTAIATVLSALYYILVAALERRWPKAGLLLGYAHPPLYVKDELGKHG